MAIWMVKIKDSNGHDMLIRPDIVEALCDTPESGVVQICTPGNDFYVEGTVQSVAEKLGIEDLGR